MPARPASAAAAFGRVPVPTACSRSAPLGICKPPLQGLFAALSSDLAHLPALWTDEHLLAAAVSGSSTGGASLLQQCLTKPGVGCRSRGQAKCGYCNVPGVFQVLSMTFALSSTAFRMRCGLCWHAEHTGMGRLRLHGKAVAEICFPRPSPERATLTSQGDARVEVERRSSSADGFGKGADTRVHMTFGQALRRAAAGDASLYLTTQARGCWQAGTAQLGGSAEQSGAPPRLPHGSERSGTLRCAYAWRRPRTHTAPRHAWHRPGRALGFPIGAPTTPHLYPLLLAPSSLTHAPTRCRRRCPLRQTATRRSTHRPSLSWRGTSRWCLQ